MILLSVTALYVYYRKPIKFSKHFIPFFSLSLIFVSVLISGINSEDFGVWIDFLRKKLPFLILPFTFYILKDYFAIKYYKYVALFVWLIALSSLIVLFQYLLNYESINKLISRGQSIPTPIDHIKYSIYVAFSGIASMILYYRSSFVFYPKEKIFYLIISVFLFIFIHILAVRSGIAVFYASVFLLGLVFYIKKRKYKSLLLFLAALIVIPFIAYKSIPSLHRKVSYMNYDLNKYLKGEGAQYSDSERIYSYKVGWQLFKENKLLGTGISDLKAECQKKFKTVYGLELDKYPHNQYLYTLAGMGLIGLIFLLLSTVYPLFHFRNNADVIFLVFNCIILVSFLVENTLERSYSTGFYLFFILSGLCFQSKK